MSVNNLVVFFSQVGKSLRMAGLLRLISILIVVSVMSGLAFSTIIPTQSAYAAGISVDRADDPAVTASGVGAAACTAAANDCSLRGATLYANAHPGTTINVPAGTYQLTIDGASENGLCYDATIGDLDIAGNNTIIAGAGAAATIIQQTRPNDRVICVDQNLVGNFNFSISDVTITGGRDTFGICGGGMVSGYPGDVTTVTNVIFSNNLTSGGSSPWGGGLCNGAGALTVSGSTFTGNSATGQGGGLYYSNVGSADTNTLSLDTSTFSNNVSGANGGGLLVTTTNSAYTVTRNTFTGNTASGINNGNAIYNTSGTLNASYNRFVNPAAGNDVYGNAGATTNITNNWWGCNGGPGATGCDTVGGGGTNTYNPWIILKTTASPGTINSGGATTLTAGLLQNSSGGALTAANVAALVGLPVTWTNAVNGSFSAQQTTIQSGGTATATFTHNGVGSTASGQAKTDNVQDADTSATASITIIALPDLTVAMSNDVSGTTALGNNWVWKLHVANGSGSAANFTSGQTILTDDLPNTSIAYGAAAAGNGVNVTNIGNISCAVASSTLTCVATGAVSIGAPGSFDVTFTATPSAVGTYANPRSEGSCAVDPNNNVSETSESNNNCNSDSVSVTKANTTTAITSHLPSPSIVGQAITIVYTVTGSGTPSGDVTVSDGVGDSCTASVALGTCNLTPTSAGSPLTLTATYAGDTNFNGSTSVGVSHTVTLPPTYTISGALGANGAGASVAFTGGTPVTADGSGNYSFVVNSGWTGTITPTKTGVTFNPLSITVSTSVTADLPNQNFTGTINTYTVSGALGANGAGASVAFTGGTPVTADGSGNYSFTVNYGWTGTITPTKTGVTFNPLSITVSTPVTANLTGQNFGASLNTYTVSGALGANGAGASVAFTGGTPVTADSSGNYSFTVNYGWTGTITPTKTGVTFTPLSITVSTSVTADLPNQNFTGTINTYTVSGALGANGAGASVAFTGGTPVTADGSGNYSFTVNYGWTGTITPTKAGVTFTPLSIIVSTPVTANLTGQNFSASLNTYTVSGALGANGAGASVAFTGGTPVTADSSGNYSFTVNYGWTGTITPTKTGVTFNPLSITVSTSVTADLPNQNFTGTINTYTVSGALGANGAGASVAFTGDTPVTANGSGNYSFVVNSGWTGTITPTKTGVTFTPLSITVSTPVTADLSNQNFTATANTYTVSGALGANGAGASVAFTGGTPVTADGSGNYSFTVNYGWTGTITPTKAGVTFNPLSIIVSTPVTANLTGQNFSASLNTYTVSGALGANGAGASIAFTGGTPVTANGSGNYSFTVNYGWTGTITPTKTGVTFNPLSITVSTSVTADLPNQNFTGTINTYTVSGALGANGAGASIAFTGGTPVTADGSGNYSFTVNYGWTGTITPIKPGYTFSPASITVSISVTADLPNQNFTTTKTLSFSDILVVNGGAWNKYEFATGNYLGGVWTGTAAGCTPALIDYDGDKIKEYSQLCGGAWHFYNKDGSYNKGIWVGDFPGSVPVPGDYNGDGVDEPVLFLAGTWHFYDFATASYDAANSKWIGAAPGCVPAPLDYNGDGKMKFSLFCGGPWHFFNSDGSYNKGIWIGGSTSNLPAPADYDGNGTEDVVLFASGTWHFFDFATGAYNAARSTSTGLPVASAKPAPIDYNKDGSLDFVQYANGTWYFYNANGSLNKSIATGSPASAVPITRRFLP